MNSRAYNRERHIHNRDSLSPDLIESISKVLEAAAGNLQSNIFLFPDVDSEVNFASEWNVYGKTTRTLFDEPCFGPVNDAVMGALAIGPFPVVIWISSRALLTTVPVFRTGVLAHELGHARQIEHRGDVLDAWESYEAFLTEKQQPLSQWERPLDIEAELFARKMIRKLHPDENLDLLLGFYKYDDYKRVLQFESSGRFNLLKYFKDVVRRGPSGFRQWVSTGDRMDQKNAILSQLAPE